MGLLGTFLGPVERLIEMLPLWQLISFIFASIITLVILVNISIQLFLKNPNEPPVVFHLIPLVGSTITYGIDPYKFFFACREKYGDVFTFILLGRKTTVCLGTKGNEFILNGKLKDVCAEEVYTPLTTPVFGKDVIYDCPNSKLMEQKKFVKFGLTSDALRSYVTLIVKEVDQFVATSPAFRGQKGTFDICSIMAEITIYTASGSLQGKEVRKCFDGSIAELYHDLDMGFSPINFMLPFAPLPHNRRRDRAQKRMAQFYMDIIQERRKTGGQNLEQDMIWNLMSCSYKDGTPVPDQEIAHMMIALLMAGQHSSSSQSAWIMIRLATRPDIQEELLAEQKRVLGDDLPPLTYENVQELSLNTNVVKETLRLHAPIHSMMRKVKSPMPITVASSVSKSYTIPTTHTLLAAPGVTSRIPKFFPEPMLWEPHRWDEGHPLACRSTKADDSDEKDEQIDYGYGFVSKGSNSPYLPFGAGRHRCIGEQFAYVQLTTILAAMVRLMVVRNQPGKEGIVATDYSSLFSRPMAPAMAEWERRGGSGERSVEQKTVLT